MKTVAIQPPDGEFLVMNYRINGEYPAPFRIYPFIDEVNPYKLAFTIKVRANFPQNHFATSVVVKFAVPKSTVGVNFELPKGVRGQTNEYNQMEQKGTWTIAKF